MWPSSFVMREDSPAVGAVPTKMNALVFRFKSARGGKPQMLPTLDSSWNNHKDKAMSPRRTGKVRLGNFLALLREDVLQEKLTRLFLTAEADFSPSPHGTAGRSLPHGSGTQDLPQTRDCTAEPMPGTGCLPGGAKFVLWDHHLVPLFR